MVPKLFRSGKSFKGVFRYLATDPKANTAERVPWTHTLNCAHDHVPSAMDEMIWTARSADWLKRQAGVRTGGSPLKDPVRHFSLNWHPDDHPTREHMVETVEQFLKFMKWDEHQAVIFCHDDRKHDHVHVVVNAVHPETGRTLDSRFDRSRAQRWALAYEQDRTLRCEQRLLPENERRPAPTREAWQKMKDAERQFEQDEAARTVRMPDYFERADAAVANAKEWEALKGYQRDERKQFFEQGKQAYRDVRNVVLREVRDEFRPRWKAYYTARRCGDDPTALAATKASLMKAQNAALDERRTKECDELRERRDQAYAAILEQQRVDRAELGRRQQQGLRTYQLLDAVYPGPEPDGAPEKERTGSRWDVHRESADGRADREADFKRGGQFVTDPYAGFENEPLNRPGVFRDGKPIAPERSEADAFGRSLRATETHRFSQVREPEPVPEPQRSRAAEMTEAASERARVQKAREMNEQRDQSEEAAALHASWERRRSRGSRDRGRV